MSSATDTFIGKRIGRYEVRERIGAGGMARVFKGWDSNLERLVAIKILHDHLTDDPTFKERFEREARLVAGLNHPNIVQVYDYDVTTWGDQILSYMVMPLIVGDTLNDVLEALCERGERMERSRVLSVMLNITAALSYAHARGMVHRDVKPGNILFDEHGQAILTDFGIARLKEAAQLTQEGATVGTPTYISPEQAVGKPVDARSDIYALGVILYEMLAGEPPFMDENSISIILKHINDPIPSLSKHLPAEDAALDAVIFKALAKNPDDRYQTAEALASDLAQALGTSPSRVLQAQTMPKLDVLRPPNNKGAATAILTPPPPAPVRASRSSLLTAGAISIAVISLLITLALVFTQRPQPGTTTTGSDLTKVGSMTGNEDLYFLSTFSSDDTYNSGWPQTTEGALQRQITTDGLYRFENQLRNTAATTIYNPSNTYEDGTITLEGMLDEASPVESGYGIVFRYVDELNYNVFAVDGRGRYSIWALTSGNWQELRRAPENWTPSDFVKPVGQKNQLIVTFNGDHLVGYVNQEVVADVQVDAATVQPGAVGLYLGSTSSGGATALIDVYQITGDVASMTGDGQP